MVDILQQRKENPDTIIINRDSRRDKLLSKICELYSIGMEDIRSQNRKGNMIVRPLNINFDKFDRSMTFGNKEFFVNAMESLMGVDDLIPLRSKTITLRPLNKEKVVRDRSYWKAINVFIPIFVIFIFGLLYNFIRKRRFS